MNHPHEPKPLIPPMAGTAKPVPAKLPERNSPIPAACLRTPRLPVPCDTCGVLPRPVHSPIDAVAFYCPRCCPYCSAGAVAAPTYRKGERIALAGP